MITIEQNRSLYTHYLKGTGIEIGALNSPLRFLHNNARVRYVDYQPTDELSKHYPHLTNLTKVDLISSAEQLEGIEDDSLDFIVANHVVEHLVNPIKTLAIWHGKLKKHGILFLAFPDALCCPDKIRPITPLSHHLRDFCSNTSEASDEHLLGFVFAWNPHYFQDPDEIKKALNYLWDKDLDYIDSTVDEMLTHNRENVKKLLANRNNECHHHVFNYQSMKDLFSYLYQNFDFKYRLIDLSMKKHFLSEYIFILRKTEESGGSFRDEFAETSEERETFLEQFVKENVEVVEQQQKILDERYEIIQEQRATLDERCKFIQEQRSILDQRYEIVEEQRKALEHSYEIIHRLTKENK